MDIIQRNFFRLILSGSMGEYEPVEPMSPFKWNRLMQIAKIQGVVGLTLKGIKALQYEKTLNIPQELVDKATEEASEDVQEENVSKLANPVFKRRLEKIRKGERHAIDCSVETLELLDIIVANVYHMLNSGVSLKLILKLGAYLRTKGDKVDFVKLDNWLTTLHIRRMAQLEGSILIDIFNFEPDELPFVEQVEKGAKGLVMRSLLHNEQDEAKNAHLKQNAPGFITNNTAVVSRNIRRSMRYIDYAPIETASTFFSNIAKSFSEIEE